MTSLQEYDLEFKPVFTVKGHGIFWLTKKAVNEIEDDPFGWDQDIEMYNVERATPTTISNSWYADVHQYLESNTFPSYLSAQQKRVVILKVLSY